MSKIYEIPPSTTALRAFEASARLMSFTDAAAELNLTQGAVSHQIKELEVRLDVKLFHRAARGISLTDAGMTYLPYVREALDRLRAGTDALRLNDVNDILTVSCSPNFAAKWLVPRLGAFYSQHPDVDLRISAAMQHVTFDNDGIDVAIRHGEGDWPHLDVTQLCQEQLFPVCSPHLPGFTDNGNSRLEDLAGHPLLHDKDRSGWRKWLQAVGADASAFDLDHGPVFSDTSLTIDAAVAGQGVTLARSALAALDLQAGRLIRPVRDSLQAAFAYWIVCPKPRAKHSGIGLFRQWLVDQANADQAGADQAGNSSGCVG